jgi:DNA-binding transcriptional LysR family regulator
MDKLKALRTFVAIVDRGSLTAAAEALHSSLPAVVRTLAALEAQLGVRLLHRTTRRITLTEDGRQYLERARRILADIDEADRLLGAGQEAPSGALHVTAPVLFGQLHVAPAVTRFLQQHPAMRVQLTLLDRVVNLVEEGLDVGIRIGHLQDSTLVAQGVGEIRRVVVASPALLRRHGMPAHPRELAAAPCLCFSGLDGRRWLFREGGRSFGVMVNGPMESNLAAPILDACVAGLGFARCLSYQAEPLLRARRLRPVLADYEGEPWPVHITYPSARLLPWRTRVFIDWIKRALQESAPALEAAAGAPRSKRQRGRHPDEPEPSPRSTEEA